jgi:hypothetical protein
MTYTNEQIAAFARAQGCDAETFKRRWAIMINGAYFVHGQNGYLPPIKMSDLPVSMPRDLAAVPKEADSPAGIEWEVPWGDSTKSKSTEALLKEYATVARKLVASMAIEYSYYDDTTQTFFERVCPLRKLLPEYDEQIDKWLRLLGGKDANIFLDWIATATDLARVTCAIYLHAGKDYGKTLFANGMARLWGNMPTEMDSVVSSFNSAILNSPLIFADEELPKGVTSGFVRRFVGTPNRALRRKGLPEADLMGAIRLIIAANNDNLLKFDDEEFSSDDINAVAARIVYVRCDPGASDFLKSIGGYEGTRDWVSGDKIAKHALWLRDNRAVKPGRRFLVEGAVDMIHRKLATSGPIRGQVIEWISRALVTDWGLMPNPGIRFGGGELYVNASFVKDTWERIIGDNRSPSLQKIGRAFKPLSVGERRFKLGSRRADFYKIDVTHIYDSCLEMQVLTREAAEKLINRLVAVDDGEDGGSGGPTSGGSNVFFVGTNGANGTNGAVANGVNGANGANDYANGRNGSDATSWTDVLAATYSLIDEAQRR